MHRYQQTRIQSCVPHVQDLAMEVVFLSQALRRPWEMAFLC